MFRRPRRSLVFIYPDYHCSFFYRDELRRLGWRADIYIPRGFPELLLFDKPDFAAPERVGGGRWVEFSTTLRTQRLYLMMLLRYKYHFYSGNLEHFTFFEESLRLRYLFGKSFRINLLLAKLLGCKILYLPSGSPDEEMPNVIAALGNDEEGVAVRDVTTMKTHFAVLRRYSDLNIGFGALNSTQYAATHFKYKSIDLELWSPHIDIPREMVLPSTSGIRILHSFMLGKERIAAQVGNIKGTKYVVQAVERLRAEGHDVELLSFDNVPTAQYRYLQVQADIVVEELVRGTWGSTAVECMALGKPVVTYVRSDWEARYYRLFPETKPLPLVNANKWTIYEVLKKLIDDATLRREIGIHSRQFAEQHLNPAINVPVFADYVLRNIK
jgi:hypothetical protein